MESKKIIIICMLLVLVGALFFVMPTLSGEVVSEEIIEIGATFSLTGNLAIYGLSRQKGMIMAQDEINSNGGINGKKLRINFMDNTGDVKKAVSDIKYFTDMKEVSVIYNALEFLTLGTKDITEEKGVSMISFTTYRLKESDNVKYTFRDYWDFEDVGRDFGIAANNLGSKKLGVISQVDSSSEYLKKGLSNYEGEIVLWEKFNFGENSFKTQLMKLKESDADTFLFYGYPNYMAQIVKEMRELGYDDVNLILTEGCETSVMIGNEDLFEKTSAITYLSAEIRDNEEFVLKFKERFSEEPRPDSYYGYSSVMEVSKVLEKCKDLDSECIRSGLSGYFDSENNKYRRLPLVYFENGEWVEF